MLKFSGLLMSGVVSAVSVSGPAFAADLCEGFGPQAPRDISSAAGTNTVSFPMAPPAADMNLCDIHTHTNAEHKGPGFSVSGGEGEHGGWKCNETANLTAKELKDPTHGHGTFHGVKPGDTIEVHWVYTTCDVDPGPGLGSCFSDACTNPSLRVESAVLLVVNDENAPSFANYAFDGNMVNGLNQPKSLPDSGTPVVFEGSTTGPSYTQATCSPMQVTWSVRPACSKVNFESVMAWGEHNVFGEEHSHGVRQIVTAPELLSEIK